SDTIFELTPQELIYVTSEITPESEGEYNIEVRVDVNNDILEADEANNIAYKIFKLYPDLIIQDDGISFSNDNPPEGTKITVYVTIENIGSVDADTNFYIELYNGKPNSIEDGGSGVAVASVEVAKSIALNRDYTFELTWKVSKPTSTNEGSDSTISMYVIIDSGDDITELSEDNNFDSRDLTITKKLDISEESDDFGVIIAIGVLVLIIILAYLFVVPALGKKKGLFGNILKPSSGKKPAKSKKGSKKRDEETKGTKKVKPISKDKLKPPSKLSVVEIEGDSDEEKVSLKPKAVEPLEVAEVEEVEEEAEEVEELIEVEAMEVEEEYDDDLKPKRSKKDGVDFSSMSLIGLR
ncbi:MAG: hypothetical protein KAJ51_11240, partial [Thermoplasmata archaeon]|nr:hypothetical protein [Thermoplasmata archaeon]